MAKRKEIQCEFNSVAEFVEYVENNKFPNSYAYSYNEDDFCSTSGGEALRIGKIGDPEFSQALFDAVANVKNAGEGETSYYRRDNVGEFFDVGDAIAGVPDCWYSAEKETRKTAIDIIFNVGAWCRCTQDQLKNRGAVLVSLVDALSAGGYLPKITLMYSGHNKRRGNRYKEVSWSIVVENKPLDIDALAFMACNPAACRRVSFMWIELAYNKPDCSDICYCYRCHGDFNKLRATHNETTPFVYFDYLCRGKDEYTTAERARRVMDQALAQLANGVMAIEMPA